jgi:TatD DNase family protein
LSGILTYKNAVNIQEAAKQIPLNRILIETDAPFLSPAPVRGQVNEPANVRFVLEKLQSLRSEDPKAIETTVFENSLRFYNIT